MGGVHPGGAGMTPVTVTITAIEQTAVATPHGVVVSPWYEDRPGSTPRRPGLDGYAQADAYRKLHHAFAGYILLGREIVVTVAPGEVV